jgi:hypothetical protein
MRVVNGMHVVKFETRLGGSISLERAEGGSGVFL